MEEQLKDGKAKATDHKPPIDPLRRVFIPVEKRMSDGRVVFQTSDKTDYERRADGSIRRSHPKINGKVARRLRREARAKA